MAWAVNGIQGKSICVSAAGSLRNGKSDVALAPRDGDLDGHGSVHGCSGGIVLLCCRPAHWLADQPRPQCWQVIGWNEHGRALVYRPRLLQF